MRRQPIAILLALFLFFSFSHAQPQEQQEPIYPDIQWQAGPDTAMLGSIAQIILPAGYVFADGEATKQLMKMMGNIISGNEVGFFAPDSENWFIVFEFNDIGYVKDDEKEELDADQLLESIRESTEKANEIRRANGFTGLHVLGWEVAPHYDEISNNLEWAIKAQDDSGEFIINHNTRLLGRKGVMEATLVVDNQQFRYILPVFKEALTGFSFQSGEKYAEYRESDKIAEYGLSALIAGGAAAVAVKSGLLKHLWKIIVVAAAGIGAFLKRIFGSRSKES